MKNVKIKKFITKKILKIPDEICFRQTTALHNLLKKNTSNYHFREGKKLFDVIEEFHFFLKFVINLTSSEAKVGSRGIEW